MKEWFEMKYEEFDGSIEELIRKKLREIEEKEDVRILHAIESGSRSWGFASPDSDYDVRFIYVRNKEFYLSLQKTKDFINWELNDVLDINGWDLEKVLKLFHKSNAAIFEWSNSPIVYETTEEWSRIRQRLAEPYFSCKSVMYHYYGAAKKTYLEYLQGDRVRYKKYFYALRPILACKWIEEKKNPPPVLFAELVDSVLEEGMKGTVQELLEKKVEMPESEKAPKIELLNQYLEEKLEYYKALLQTMPEDRTEDWEPLENLFRESLRL